jgi:hypothetical protein
VIGGPTHQKDTGARAENLPSWSGKNYDTLRTYGSIARAYEMSMRVNNLSFTHHRIALDSIEDQTERQKLLKEASKSKLSVRIFQEFLDKPKEAGEPPKSQPVSKKDREKLEAQAVADRAEEAIADRQPAPSGTVPSYDPDKEGDHSDNKHTPDELHRDLRAALNSLSLILHDVEKCTETQIFADDVELLAIVSRTIANITAFEHTLRSWKK